MADLTGFFGRTTNEPVSYELYYASVPFGVFMSKGELDGVMFLGFGGIRGEFTTSENYILKYFDGGQLKTAIVDSRMCPIVCDGTFRVEITERCNMMGDEDHLRYYTYVVYVPSLPTLNQTMTTEWQSIG